ncbi:helix-turn-helix domain-containing protein [Curtobacterium sp. MCBA15_001]|uniref:helix-turn-helix domain-containing protein n=1 Tax=Curtobacterium sp. MCBA15_001 TaxID=1898731 RepID=UPI0008DCF4D5|nr:helix-turn-helix domain-containing protein [Curtobacterium sp. MCBA15_001]OIH95240.1 helix-turn-helix domain-containing protein [Curtobacterium sp. MCBA15_001]
MDQNENETVHLTLAETAKRLRKSQAGIRYMIQTGTGPRSGLIGGRRMFRAADVEAYIASQFETASA